MMGISAGASPHLWYDTCMDPADLTPPQEASLVEIRAENEITLREAVTVSEELSFPLGLSTLQRWAIIWRQLGSVSPVKALLVTTRTGKEYKLDREDFTAWALKEKENKPPREASEGLKKPHEASQGL